MWFGYLTVRTDVTARARDCCVPSPFGLLCEITESRYSLCRESALMPLVTPHPRPSYVTHTRLARRQDLYLDLPFSGFLNLFTDLRYVRSRTCRGQNLRRAPRLRVVRYDSCCIQRPEIQIIRSGISSTVQGD